MRIYVYFLLVLLLGLPVSASAEAFQQELRITGTVVSAGEPLPGVSVLVKGTSHGTITDMDGNYSISATGNALLVCSFV